jgi:NADPH2:quinone reductase
MKALQMARLGPLEGLEHRELERPAPRSGELRIRVEASAISHADLLLALGRYQLQPPVPYVPGSEFAGTVEAIGDGTEGDWHLGERVCGSATAGGAWAEAVCVPAAAVQRIGEAALFTEAAALAVPYGTMWHALVDRGALRPGETVFVLGAAGSVGLAAVQLARAFGARVIAGGSTSEKRALARAAGADATIDTSVIDWRNALKALTPSGVVDVVVDPVGGAFTEPAFRSLGWGGRHLVLGFAGGGIAALPANLPLLKGAALVGVDIRQFSQREPVQAAANLRGVMALHARGDLRPTIAGVWALSDHHAALAAMQGGDAVGRVVLRPD